MAERGPRVAVRLPLGLRSLTLLRCLSRHSSLVLCSCLTIAGDGAKSVPDGQKQRQSCCKEDAEKVRGATLPRCWAELHGSSHAVLLLGLDRHNVSSKERSAGTQAVANLSNVAGSWRAVKDRMGGHLFVGRQRNTLGAWCGQVVEAARLLRVRIWRLSRVSDRSMQKAGQLQGMASAGALKAQEALSLEDVQQEARRALVWLDFALNGHKNGTARRPHFWVRFGNLSFPKIIFFGGLVFGA